MPIRSRSSPSRSSLLALLASAAVAGCYIAIDSRNENLEFTLDAAGGAVVRLTARDAKDDDAYTVEVSGTLAHRGPDPCPVALFLVDDAPDPAIIPVLTGPGAPTDLGEPFVETVLLPPDNGNILVRELGHTLFPGAGVFMGGPSTEFDGASGAMERHLVLATCAAPEIDAALTVSFTCARPQGRRMPAMAIDLLRP